MHSILTVEFKMETDSSTTDNNTFTTVLVFIFTFLLVYINTRRQRGIPPGPVLFPIVGNLPSLLTSDPLHRLEELGKIYGDVYGIYSGMHLLVFLNGYQTIHDASLKKGSEFKYRAKPKFDQGEPVHCKGLIFPGGDVWKEGRSFTLKTLHDICYSDKRFVENIVNEEVNVLKGTVCRFKEPFDIERYMNASVANVMFRIVYGHRFDLQDEELNSLLQTIRKFSTSYLRREVVLNCIPILKDIPGDILGINKTRAEFRKIDDFLTRFIDRLKDDEEKLEGRYVGHYLKHIEICERDGVKSSMDEENMKISAYHLIVAGTETTASTLRWILLYLIRNPQIQEKLYADITAVLGTEPPAIEDRNRLPYVHAVILEGLRISHVAHLGMPHTVVKDTELHGYLIPAGCTVIPNLGSALMDPDIWDNPETFCPERFIHSRGGDIKIPKEFIPFSLGPRSCLGETLAQTELFLFLVGLVQKLQFLPNQDGVLPDTSGVLATTLNAKSFRMTVKER